MTKIIYIIIYKMILKMMFLMYKLYCYLWSLLFFEDKSIDDIDKYSEF